jgi:hypothetical protein
MSTPDTTILYILIGNLPHDSLLHHITSSDPSSSASSTRCANVNVPTHRTVSLKSRRNHYNDRQLTFISDKILRRNTVSPSADKDVVPDYVSTCEMC